MISPKGYSRKANPQQLHNLSSLFSLFSGTSSLFSTFSFICLLDVLVELNSFSLLYIFVSFKGE